MISVEDLTKLAGALAALVVAIGTLYNAIVAARHSRLLKETKEVITTQSDTIEKVEKQTNGMLAVIRELEHDRGVGEGKRDEKQRQAEFDKENPKL